MITLQNYGAYAKSGHVGQLHKAAADMLEEVTWDDEIESRKGYLYDWYHDLHQTQLDDLKPYDDAMKIPMDVKFIVVSSQTMAKDAITYHIQMRPSQETCVDYYDEVFGKRYGAAFPCGLYIDLQDSDDKWNRWLVVALADYNDPQFPTFEILRCDYVLNAVIDGVKYNFPIALRSQNSYNSGIWRDYRTETTEDQQKFMIPMSRLTEKIWYNKRFLIDNMVITDECRAWRVSKVNRINYKGLVMVTLVQDHFNKDTDCIEKDSNGNTIALWANLYSEPVEPTDFDLLPDEPVADYGIITYVGKNEIKVGGSNKRIGIQFFDKDGTPTEYKTGTWSFTIDGAAVQIEPTVASLDGSQIKIQIPNNGLYINKVLTITHTVTESGLVTTHEMSIVSL